MATKTKKKPAKKKVSAKKPAPPARAMSLEQLLGKIPVENDLQKKTIRTAAETGFFTDGCLTTALSKEERTGFNRKASKIPKDLAYSMEDYQKLAIGPRLELKVIKEGKKDQPAIATLKTVGDTEVQVLAAQFLTLMKRHPKASFHLAFENPAEQPIIVTQGSVTVGYLKIKGE